MPLHIEQFRYAPDNFGYVLFGLSEAVAVDGGAWEDMLAFVRDRHLTLRLVTHTHGHHDHTCGSEALIRHSGARLLGFEALQDGSTIALDGERLQVYRTPGHSADSVCFHAERFLLTGDTLFNGTIGNCFSGNLRGFYASIRRLAALPDDTLVFAGHDYVDLALAFARHLEPGNGEIDRYRDRIEPACVFSRIADERRINPYLRFNDPAMIAILKARGLPVETEWDRWQSIMSIEE